MHSKSSISVILLLTAGFAYAQAKPQPRQSTRLQKPAKKTAVKTGAAVPAAQAAASQAAPAAPLRPEQMPAVPPRVSYNNGQLTIVAQNSSMAEIISAIRNATGTKIETTGGPSGERVAAKIGPAPLRDVLVSLFDGSRLDYIILGSAQDPAAVDRVILTPRTGGANNANNGVAINAASRMPAQAAPPRQITPEEAGDAADNDEEGSEGFAEPPVVPTPGANDRPNQIQPGQPNQLGEPVNPNFPQPQQPQDQQNVKTPEQLMEELRRMELERRNQQPGVRPERGDRPK
jgi:hypothetical protein